MMIHYGINRNSGVQNERDSYCVSLSFIRNYIKKSHYYQNWVVHGSFCPVFPFDDSCSTLPGGLHDWYPNFLRWGLDHILPVSPLQLKKVTFCILGRSGGSFPLPFSDVIILGAWYLSHSHVEIWCVQVSPASPLLPVLSPHDIC